MRRSPPVACLAAAASLVLGGAALPACSAPAEARWLAAAETAQPAVIESLRTWC
jgi:hypothetical protein